MEDDDEGTIDVEERHNDVDHQTELDDLQKEGNITFFFSGNFVCLS